MVKRTMTRMKSSTFDRKSSWLNYLKQFEAAGKTSGWTPKEKAVSLTVALHGEIIDAL